VSEITVTAEALQEIWWERTTQNRHYCSSYIAWQNLCNRPAADNTVVVGVIDPLLTSIFNK